MGKRRIHKTSLRKALFIGAVVCVYSFCYGANDQQALSQQQGKSVTTALEQHPELAQQVAAILSGQPVSQQRAASQATQPHKVNAAAAPASQQISTITPQNPQIQASATNTVASTSLTQQTASKAQMSQSLPRGSIQMAQNEQANPNQAAITKLPGGKPANGQVPGASPNTGVSSTTAIGEVNPEWQKIIDKNAYHQVLKEAFPLSPGQIKKLRNRLDDTQRAAATAPYNRPPRPTSSSVMINLAPGATPPVIRLSQGFVSSLVFVDSTGAPWPIESYDIGNPSVFDIKWNKKNNTLMIQARAAYTIGNLAVKMVDLNTPVMLTLVPGQRVVDYRVDLRVPGLGPDAKPIFSGSGLPNEADDRLLNVLDGVPPKGSKRLTTKGADAQAWEIGSTLFLRTRFKVISPAWLATLSSADGMNAYKMAKTPMVLLSRYGKTTQLRIEGY